MTVSVRPASISDGPALAWLRHSWRAVERGESGASLAEFTDPFIAWMEGHEATHRPFVAEDDGAPVGMVWLGVVHRVPGPAQWARLGGLLQSLYVLPEHRGRGTGALLIDAVVAEAHRLGLEYVMVHPSERSFPLYRRHGFDDSPGLLELDLRHKRRKRMIGERKEQGMQLDGKNAIVYGAAGGMGGAVGRPSPRGGGGVIPVGRPNPRLYSGPVYTGAAGGAAETAVVDALDRRAVDAHAAEVARRGGIDVSFNAISVPVEQNVPLVDMPLDDFLAPIIGLCRTHFITATAAARQMTERGSGVIILLSASAAQETRHEMGGFSLACAAIEALTRSLAGEVGRKGVRVVGLRPNLTPEIFGWHEEDLPHMLKDTLTGRLPRLSEVAGTAVYLASDAAGAISGAVLNLSCGAVLG